MVLVDKYFLFVSLFWALILLFLEMMVARPHSKPMSFSYCEQVVLVKSNLLGVLVLAMGDVHLPHSFQNCYTPYQHFISPLFSSKPPHPTSCSSSGHPVVV